MFVYALDNTIVADIIPVCVTPNAIFDPLLRSDRLSSTISIALPTYHGSLWGKYDFIAPIQIDPCGADTGSPVTVS